MPSKQVTIPDIIAIVFLALLVFLAIAAVIFKISLPSVPSHTDATVYTENVVVTPNDDGSNEMVNIFFVNHDSGKIENIEVSAKDFNKMKNSINGTKNENS